jgi:hypothetical protein
MRFRRLDGRMNWHLLGVWGFVALLYAIGIFLVGLWIGRGFQP